MEALSQQIFNTENIIKIIDSDGSYDLLNELYPYRQYFDDNEILDFKDKIDDKITEYNWCLSKSLFKETSSFKFILNKFIYNDSILISIIITRLYPESIDDDYDQIIGLFTNDNIIILGVLMGHPKIETNDIVYNNSDGSGPDIIDDINNPHSLSKNLVKYYNAFLKDEFH